MSKRVIGLGLVLLLLALSPVFAQKLSGKYQSIWNPEGRNVSAMVHEQIAVVNEIAAKDTIYTQADLHRFVRSQSRINKGMLYILTAVDRIQKAQRIYEVDVEATRIGVSID